MPLMRKQHTTQLTRIRMQLAPGNSNEHLLDWLAARTRRLSDHERARSKIASRTSELRDSASDQLCPELVSDSSTGFRETESGIRIGAPHESAVCRGVIN